TRLPAAVSNRTSVASSRLNTLAAMIGPVSSNVTDRAVSRLNNVCSRLSMAAASASDRSHRQLQRISDVVQALSPANTLRRGYSITRVDGRAVTDTSHLAPGTRLTTHLYNGTIESEVSAVSHDSN
ncbi:MAG: hypothetical protein K2K26_10540, partial [Muribaculaceae bacterium]|nr:hypothetical protein [Muribaculaceae bacterium]